MTYVDGFVLPVPKRNLKAYGRMARAASKLWKSHGALDYHECALDDSRIPCGVAFGKGAKAKPTETVVFAWIVYRSKAQRDAVNAKIMVDPRMQAMMKRWKKMPFDPNRMMYGGFKTIVKA
ncbi:MAG: DUF1428 domain-containing protein [Planctomycetes bacterium]|nr:DUF1428 domain-containing protein [Planctomycetota bacterium]